MTEILYPSLDLTNLQKLGVGPKPKEVLLPDSREPHVPGWDEGAEVEIVRAHDSTNTRCSALGFNLIFSATGPICSFVEVLHSNSSPLS
jgi:hypothetical protein